MEDTHEDISMIDPNNCSCSNKAAASAMYFAVYVPPQHKTVNSLPPDVNASGDSMMTENNPEVPSESGGVFENLAEAVKLVKTHKAEGARFKTFSSSDAAKKYAMGDIVPDTPSGDAGMSGLGSEEKPPYPDPTRPQLTVLKKCIEQGDMDKMRGLLQENPRYLVNCSGDTPAIVYAGCRYNALHLAAKAGNLDACQLVLYLINSPEYLNRLYPYCTSPEITDKRRDFLLDLYLNTPDKAANETPLHYASKLGHVDIVSLLIGYEQCQRDVVNKYGETPEQLACAKAVAPPGGEEGTLMRRKIQIVEMLSTDRYYVGLYRPQDYTGVPLLRPPVDSRPGMTWDLEPKNEVYGRFGFGSPSVMRPELCLAAYAGPMNSEKAAEFYAEWSSNSPSFSANHFRSPRPERGVATPSAHIKRSDLHKGMERVGRKLAKDLEVPWTEYWPFLTSFADFSSEEGLRALQEFLESKESSSDTVDAISEQIEQLAGAGILKPVQEYTSSPIGKTAESRFREYFSPKPVLDENCEEVKGKLDFQSKEGAEDDIDLLTSSNEENDLFEDSLAVFLTNETESEISVLAEQFENLQLSSISDLSGMVLESSYSVFRDKSSETKSRTKSGGSTTKNTAGDRSKSDGEDSVMVEESDGEKEESDDDDDSFETPPSTPPATYLVGRRPTKMDFDVFLALEDVWKGKEKELIDRFPSVAKWCRVMTIFSPKERQDWPGFDSPRAKLLKRPNGGLVTSPLAGKKGD